VTSVASAGPVAVLDGPSCVLLARYLATVTPALERAGRLDAIRPAIAAIEAAASAQHEQDRRAFAAGVVDGWVTVAEAADLAGVTEGAIRRRLARGTLAGERPGKAWRVDASQLSRPPV
jgi:excisionase family DNA binding protein